MKVCKFISGFALGALAVSAIPYRIRKDKETKTLELRSLLWGVKKTPGKDKDNYFIAIPGSGLDDSPEEKPAETPVEASAEPAAE